MKTDNREAKLKALALAKASIDKKFGAGTLQSGDSVALEVETIPTGAFMLDLALGAGGLPKGRISEIFGPEGIGKTLLALGAVANAQKQGGICAYIDAEHALNRQWAEKLGVDWNDLYIAQPSSGEEALNIALTLVKSGAFDLIVVDSVPALTPLAEIEGEIGDAHMSLLARLMGQAMRVLTGPIADNDVAFLFINQLRSKMTGYGGSVAPGGRALPYQASVRIELKPVPEKVEENGEQVGVKVRANILKNKVSAPYKSVEYYVITGLGIDNERTLIDYGKKFGVVTNSGAFYYWINPETGERSEKAIGQGIAKAADALRGTELGEQVREAVRYEYNRRQRGNNKND